MTMTQFTRDDWVASWNPFNCLFGSAHYMIKWERSMVAEMLQKSKFLLCLLYSCHMKFYFCYICNIYVICFIIYLLYIYMYIICFLNLLYISIFTFLILNFVMTLLFSLYVQNCYNKNPYDYNKNICILMIRIFYVTWKFWLYGFHMPFGW